MKIQSISLTSIMHSYTFTSFMIYNSTDTLEKYLPRAEKSELTDSMLHSIKISNDEAD